MSRRNRNNNNGRLLDVPSDDDSVDNASLLSTGDRSLAAAGHDDDDAASVECGEEKLLQALELATEKSAQTRQSALQSISDVLCQRYVPDFLDDRRLTMIDLIERSLRRGKGAEVALAAQLAPQLVLQLGDPDAVIAALGPLLLLTAQNRAVALTARAKCCSALGLLAVLAASDVGDALQTMQAMLPLFADAFGSRSTGVQKAQTAGNAEASVLHCAALGAWTLLLTLCPSGDFCMLMNSGSMPAAIPSFPQLMSLLNSPHLDVRMAAGETIALVLEIGRVHDEEFLDGFQTDLIEAVRALATDSQKFRAKRDRKAQRATFRDVLHYVEDEQLPETTVRFGSNGERLRLESWADQALYGALVSVLGPGMTGHLSVNEFVRDVLGLGAPLVEPERIDVKRSRQQRHLVNAAAFKERTRLRAIDRSKKTHF